jgi:hypothetical protein
MFALSSIIGRYRPITARSQKVPDADIQSAWLTGQDDRSPSAMLLVADLFHPFDILTVERFLNGRPDFLDRPSRPASSGGNPSISHGSIERRIFDYWGMKRPLLLRFLRPIIIDITRQRGVASPNGRQHEIRISGLWATQRALRQDLCQELKLETLQMGL